MVLSRKEVPNATPQWTKSRERLQTEESLLSLTETFRLLGWVGGRGDIESLESVANLRPLGYTEKESYAKVRLERQKLQWRFLEVQWENSFNHCYFTQYRVWK